MTGRGRTLLAGAAPASPRAAVRALLALAVPPSVWFLHLNASYLLVPPSCSGGTRWPFLLVTVVALAAVAPAAVGSWRAWRDGDDGGGLVRFLGGFGLVLAVLFAAATVLVAASVVVIDPCR